MLGLEAGKYGIQQRTSSLVDCLLENEADKKKGTTRPSPPALPFSIHSRRLSCSEKLQVNDQIDDWSQQGIIRESCSDYCSPIVLCKKKDGNLRICIDYRKINSKTIGRGNRGDIHRKS
ncbi:retrovirus-related Pol polyprotein from transposon 17.6 [Trichonephila clavipes]|nr:retrovirus-related Pol polyprotein from transposon 17.6 [Trichonephila clavipes]